MSVASSSSPSSSSSSSSYTPSPSDPSVPGPSRRKMFSHHQGIDKGKGKELDPTNISSSRTKTKTNQVSQTNKAIAACTGAIAVSLLMTPFDVIKTRLQTQPPISNPKLFIPDPHLHLHSNQNQNQNQINSFNRKPHSTSSSRSSSSPPSTSTFPTSSLASTSSTTTHPATCCQQTFFTNSHSSSLICRYDPRGIPVPMENSFARLSIPTQHHQESNPSLTQPRSQSHPTNSNPTRTLPSISQSTPTILSRARDTDCAFPNELEAKKALKSYNERANENRLKGLWDGVIKVGKGEGVRGLWRGLSPTLMMTVPSQVTYMTAYDYFRTLFLSFEQPSDSSSSIPTSHNSTIPTLDSRQTSNFSPSFFNSVSSHTVFSTLTAGGIARALSATLVTPLELLRTRLQSSTNNSSSKGGAFVSLIQEVRNSPKGIKILYTGLAPTLWRDVPFSAVYFAGYEFIKRSLTGNGLGESNSSVSISHLSNSDSDSNPSSLPKEKEKDSLEEFSMAFFCGSISGSIAALLTHPADVVKTRLQAQRQNLNLDSDLSSLSDSTRRRIETRALPTLKLLLRNEGLKGAFSGLSPRIAKIAPACGIMIGSFEVVGRALSDLSGGVEEEKQDVWVEGEELGAR